MTHSCHVKHAKRAMLHDLLTLKYDIILVVRDTGISGTQTLPGLYLSEAKVRVIMIDAVMYSGVTLINGATSQCQLAMSICILCKSTQSDGGLVFGVKWGPM